jgi:hypothetical protein
MIDRLDEEWLSPSRAASELRVDRQTVRVLVYVGALYPVLRTPTGSLVPRSGVSFLAGHGEIEPPYPSAVHLRLGLPANSLDDDPTASSEGSDPGEDLHAGWMLRPDPAERRAGWAGWWPKPRREVVGMPIVVTAGGLVLDVAKVEGIDSEETWAPRIRFRLADATPEAADAFGGRRIPPERGTGPLRYLIGQSGQRHTGDPLSALELLRDEAIQLNRSIATALDLGASPEEVAHAVGLTRHQVLRRAQGADKQ